MIFGERPTLQAKDTILAHSVQWSGGRLRKGRKLSAGDISNLLAADIKTLTVAELEPDDLGEDAAAQIISAPLQGLGVRAQAAFTGRVNIFASHAGVFHADPDAILSANLIDEAITIATLPDLTRVSARQMLATIKIIPYGVPKHAVKKVCKCLTGNIVSVSQRVITTATLIQTTLPGQRAEALSKGSAAVQSRLTALGVDMIQTLTTAHTTPDIALSVQAATGQMVLILGASATSDRRDVAPSGVIQAGGSVDRFGMPVDPGNLLFLGKYKGKSVVGLPGCVESPVLNGADWVLERLVSDLDVTDRDIAQMGVGGLLKENPTRPHPRNAQTPSQSAPKITVLLLAAGASRRMRGEDKLLKPINGASLLSHTAKITLRSQADRVLVAVRADRPDRNETLPATGITRITVSDANEGMAASIRSGIRALEPDCDAVILAFADMPDITADDFNALIASFSVEDGREICRAVTADGTPGHPVLFGRRFFENLALLQGDTGARELLRLGTDYVVDVPTHGDAATTDLDTPEEWSAWQANWADTD